MAAGPAWRFRFSLLSFASPAFAGFATATILPPRPAPWKTGEFVPDASGTRKGISLFFSFDGFIIYPAGYKTGYIFLYFFHKIEKNPEKTEVFPRFFSILTNILLLFCFRAILENKNRHAAPPGPYAVKKQRETLFFYSFFM